MQRLEVSGAVRLIYKSLGVKGLNKKLIRVICNVTEVFPYFFLSCKANARV